MTPKTKATIVKHKATVMQSSLTAAIVVAIFKLVGSSHVQCTLDSNQKADQHAPVNVTYGPSVP